jgi:hypothetical protein
MKNRPTTTRSVARRISGNARADNPLTNAYPRTAFRPPRRDGTARTGTKYFFAFGGRRRKKRAAVIAVTAAP